MLLNLSFQLEDPRAVMAQYPDQVKEIFAAIAADGYNKSDPKNPGNSVYILPESMTWMLVRDLDCEGEAEVDIAQKSIHIRYDQLNFKLAGVWNSAIWKSTSLVRMHRPTINQKVESVKVGNRRSSDQLRVGEPGPFLRSEEEKQESRRNRGYPAPENSSLRLVEDEESTLS